MITIHSFVFGPFQENTYVLSDKTKECVIIDPGCYDEDEKAALAGYIDSNQLKPVRLLNTHCHVDHVFGNKFMHKKYALSPEIHEKDLLILKNLVNVAKMYGVYAEESPPPKLFLDEGDHIKFGQSVLDILFTPGHSPGSICFVNKDQQFVIGGDVLFYGSIGRTDLPGGDHATLLNSIRTKLFPLGADFKVYSGHGPETTIGLEKKQNPFVGEHAY